jgi:hypothetical protein
VLSPNPAFHGQPITYTATGSSQGPATPTGSVRIQNVGLGAARRRRCDVHESQSACRHTRHRRNLRWRRRIGRQQITALYRGGQSLIAAILESGVETVLKLVKLVPSGWLNLRPPVACLGRARVSHRWALLSLLTLLFSGAFTVETRGFWESFAKTPIFILLSYFF